ncbi:4'-phosphopantetheinyl transferase family protein [Undibacterium sp. RuTC16W]|uniref:4'-phosphopantetheinyl transferase family protein n=1 Tax=Undibacterium sp. RuTC16W TaxID=3413048 RepID=UPI003BF04048
MPGSLLLTSIPASVPVFYLPEHLDDASAALRLHRYVVIAVSTDSTQDRTKARQQIRSAIITLIQRCYQIDVRDIEIATSSGTAPRLLFSDHEAALSISHEAGLSLAAICLDSSVGIDLLHTKNLAKESFEWQDIARIYLDPDRHQMIRSLTPEQQLLSFAQEWTMLEARYKCAGMALSEWSDTVAAGRHTQLQVMPAYQLDLPENYCGSIAFSAQKTAFTNKV